MYVYSARVVLPAAVSLGGYGRERLSVAASQLLAVHGLGWDSPTHGQPFELCALDALYAGDLSGDESAKPLHRIFAASHTHTAPMLDSSKPALGSCSAAAVSAFEQAIAGAPREAVSPDRCSVYLAESPWPVYRRFDQPATAINRVLTQRAGLYPNDAVSIDRGVYLFVFFRADRAQFAIAYHACHPVTRHDAHQVSPDYVQALRAAVAHRFGSSCCLFFQGCAGDVRPNFARKRSAWLPRSRLNWRFAYPPSADQQVCADRAYAQVVHDAVQQRSFEVKPGDFSVRRLGIDIEGLGEVSVSELRIGEALVFRFLPFELSHHYHLQARAVDERVFLVSCADRVLGYLPHPSQVAFGGYEVDGSRACMGLDRRITSSDARLWQYE